MSIFKDMYALREIESLRDFHELERMLREAMERGHVIEIPVMQGWSVLSEERWYQEKATGEIYSLHGPNERSCGHWERIDLAHLRLMDSMTQ